MSRQRAAALDLVDLMVALALVSIVAALLIPDVVSHHAPRPPLAAPTPRGAQAAALASGSG